MFFNYALSVFVAFLFYGVIFNILQKVEPEWWDDTINGGFGWCLVAVCAGLWFISLPILLLVIILFILKLLTDKIADLILNHVEKRKLKKQSKQETKDGH